MNRAGAASAGAAPPRQDPATRRVPPASEDSALYTCGCGFVFRDEVSASVACPHCGAMQAW